MPGPLILRYYNGMTYEEVAETLCVAQGTVVSRIENGLKKLKERLAKLGMLALIPSLEGTLSSVGRIPFPAHLSTSVAAIAAGTGAMTGATATVAVFKLSAVTKALPIVALMALFVGGILLFSPRESSLPKPLTIAGDLPTTGERSSREDRVVRRPEKEIATSEQLDGPSAARTSLSGTVKEELTPGRDVDEYPPLADVAVSLYRGEIVMKTAEGEGRHQTPSFKVIDTSPIESVRSDANGAYCVPDLPAGAYRLCATKSGYLPIVAEFTMKAGSSKTLDLFLSRGCRITGYVRDEDGHPVRNVRIVASGGVATFRLGGDDVDDESVSSNRDVVGADDNVSEENESYAVSVTDVDGRYTFLVRPGQWRFYCPPGDWRTVAVRNGDRSGAMNDQNPFPDHNLSVRIRGDCEGPTIVVRRSLVAEGRVADNAGNPVADADVYLAKENSVFLDNGDRAFPENFFAKTDGEGRFRFDGLTSGTYIGRAIREGKDAGISPTWLKIELQDNRDDLEMTLQPGITLSGRIVNDLGETITKEKHPHWTIHVSAVPVGHPILATVGPRYGRGLIVSAPRFWRGSKTDDGYHSVIGASGAEVDDDGSFTLSPLHKGRYAVTLSFHGPKINDSLSPMPFAPSFAEIDVQSDHADFTICLKRGFRISGRVVDSAGAGVSGVAIGIAPGRLSSFSSDDGGTFQSDLLAPGQYALSIGEATRIVDIDDRDVTNILFTTDNQYGISGFLEIDNKEVLEEKDLDVNLLLVRDGEVRQRFPLALDGRNFFFRGLERGTYVVGVEITDGTTVTRGQHQEVVVPCNDALRLKLTVP